VRPGKRFSRLCIAVCAAALVLAACGGGASRSSAPRQRTVLLTEADDKRVGKEASTAVAAQMGLYEDPALEAYVSGIGQKLVRGVPRNAFRYQFQIVDQFEPNAFALPGGFIYISRGLLALCNSEDELANVIGHEITHAAHRHAAMQQALAVDGPLAMPWVRAARQASYSRDMERDADRGGQFLAGAAGYDPMALSTFLSSMGQVERLRIGHARLPSFFDTHPGSTERAAVNAARAQEIRWQRDPSRGDPRSAYLRRVDGLALGQRPEGGIFEGDRFLHPDLDFQIRFPPGWRTSNTNQAVGAVSPRGDAMVYVMADQPAGDPKQVAEDFVVKTGREVPLEVVRAGPVKIGHIDAWRMELRARGRGGSLEAVVTFLPYRGATWRITGLAPASVAPKYAGRMLNTARSFRPLSDAERGRVQSTQLRLVTARPGEDLQALGRRTGNDWDPSRTAVYNGLFTTHRFSGGELVKIARVEAYTPRPSD
jgi:predicted Zn-dependent protease